MKAKKTKGFKEFTDQKISQKKSKKVMIETSIDFSKWVLYSVMLIIYVRVTEFLNITNKIINFVIFSILFLFILFLGNLGKEYLIREKK